MRNRYQQQLEKLKKQLIDMCDLCELAIDNSVCALFAEDQKFLSEYSNYVFDVDREIDTAESEIEKCCTKLIIQQQPIAKDLRVITVALKMISDLERIGDQASDIAELAQYIQSCSLNHKLHLKQMAQSVTKMLKLAVDAYVNLDMDQANEAIKMDDEIDDYFTQIKNEIISIIAKEDTDAELCVDLLMVAKYFERIGDHAENIAEWVQYSITGEHK